MLDDDRDFQIIGLRDLVASLTERLAADRLDVWDAYYAAAVVAIMRDPSSQHEINDNGDRETIAETAARSADAMMWARGKRRELFRKQAKGLKP